MTSKRTSNGKGAGNPALPREYAQGLARVRRAAAKHTEARAYLEDAIRRARAEGASLRAIADEAGLSHEWVRQITES